MYRICLMTAVALGTIGVGISGDTVVEKQTSTQLAITKATAITNTHTEGDDPIVPPNFQANRDSVI